MRVSLIWAQARDGVIGHDGAIPWRVPEDMVHFKELTAAGTVIMGRRTWDSLPPRFRPLDGRRNVVVTRDASWSADGAEAAHSLDEALGLAAAVPEPAPVWIIGGGEIYRLSLPIASRLEVTELDLDVEGDTRAPGIDASWALVDQGEWLESRSGIRYRFLGYDRA